MKAKRPYSQHFIGKYLRRIADLQGDNAPWRCELTPMFPFQDEANVAVMRRLQFSFVAQQVALTPLLRLQKKKHSFPSETVDLN